MDLTINPYQDGMRILPVSHRDKTNPFSINHDTWKCELFLISGVGFV